jgi:thiol-disulfide isomerase/thioredoxin/outer membrane lipoprotein-sorting protein
MMGHFTAACATLLVICSAGVYADPSTQPAPDVVAILDHVTAAYSSLQSAEFDGHVSGHFDVAGQQKDDDVPFTSSWRSPNFFRHQLKDSVMIGSTGQKAFAYDPDRKVYITNDAPKDRSDLSDWPQIFPEILQQQNPSMLMALAGGGAGPLKDLAPDMTHLPDTALDGKSYPTVQFELPDHQVVTMLFDPKTSLLRQAKFDLRKKLENRGATDVKAALVTIDYTQSATPAAPAAAETFAWAPPEGATLAAANVPAPDGSDQGGSAAQALVGKPAPDFTLPGFDDKPVKLASLKGSVVVLDFWATWCGPCVGSLPRLDQLNKDQAPNGLKVFAVNLQEEKDAVQTFVHKQGWTLPVLLDSDGNVAKQYAAEAIPETVIVGKDGIVKKVFVGAGEDTEDQIKTIVVHEMGG